VSSLSLACPADKRFPSSGNPRWIDTACFQLPRLGELGNTPRDFVNGLHYFNADAAVIKNIKNISGIRSGSVRLRAEVFNLFNRTNFNVSGAGIFAGSGP